MPYKKRILLVDDEQSFTRVLKLNLENTGFYQVREENQGLRALESAREFKPDLILLDIMMPDISGDEVAAQIQGDPFLGDVPIVFLTAVASKDEVENHSGTIGGYSFVAKPAGIEEVTDSIRKHLGDPPAGSAPFESVGQARAPSTASPIPKGPLGAPGHASSNEHPHVTRDFIISILVVLLATGGYVGYRLYNQSQQMLQATLSELEVTRSRLSTIAPAPRPSIQQQTTHAQAQDGPNRGGPLELVLPEDSDGGPTTQVSALSGEPGQGLSLKKFASSVVKLHCRAHSQSRDTRRGSGILYRNGSHRSDLGPYYIQTSLHVVDTLDGSDAQCAIHLYPDHTQGNVFLLYKSRGYRFYRKDIDMAFLEPEIITGNSNGGAFRDLAEYALDDKKNPLCEFAEMGDHVSILGYPGAGGKTLTVTEGIISGFEFDGPTRFIKSSAKLDRGNSGGAAIKDSGCVIGIPSFVQRGQLESIGRILDLNYVYKVILN